MVDTFEHFAPGRTFGRRDEERIPERPYHVRDGLVGYSTMSKRFLHTGLMRHHAIFFVIR